MHIFIPHIKFLCLTLWLGRISTDDVDANHNDDDERRAKHDCTGSLVDKQIKSIDLSQKLHYRMYFDPTNYL